MFAESTTASGASDIGINVLYVRRSEKSLAISNHAYYLARAKVRCIGKFQFGPRSESGDRKA
jgi:hypothetical protein